MRENSSGSLEKRKKRKKKLRHRSTPTEKKMRNHEVRDLGRQLCGFSFPETDVVVESCRGR
jgi:hypothetical protein